VGKLKPEVVTTDKKQQAISKDDKSLSEIIADTNPQVKSGNAGNATAARGFQKTND
jgi:hypothetical protein